MLLFISSLWNKKMLINFICILLTYLMIALKSNFLDNLGRKDLI
jgi:hypothetical protein